MAKQIRNRQRHVDVSYCNVILEIAEGDSFVDCTFLNCTLVGMGGYRFTDCVFLDCDDEMFSHRPGVFVRCNFGESIDQSTSDDEEGG